MISKILISVIIPHYNDIKHLPRCINSICRQKQQPSEIIIIDDNSEIKTKNALIKLKKNYKTIRLYFNKKNCGVSFSINKGLKKARGNFVVCFSANDFYIGNYFQEATYILRKYSNCGLVCSNPGLYTTKKKILKYNLNWNQRKSCFLCPQEFSKAYAHDWRRAGGGTSIIWNKKYLNKIGGFSKKLYWMCDWYAYVILGLKHGVCYIPKTFAVWRESECSLGANAYLNKRAQLSICIEIAKQIEKNLSKKEKDLFFNYGMFSIVPFSLIASILTRNIQILNKTFLLRKTKIVSFNLIKKFIPKKIINFLRVNNEKSV